MSTDRDFLFTYRRRTLPILAYNVKTLRTDDRPAVKSASIRLANPLEILFLPVWRFMRRFGLVNEMDIELCSNRITNNSPTAQPAVRRVALKSRRWVNQRSWNQTNDGGHFHGGSDAH